MSDENTNESVALDKAWQLRQLVNDLQIMGRNDLLLRAITVPVLEDLRIEAARGSLSKLIITKDYRFVLEDSNREVPLTPIHRAVYILFLNHPEGIEFKLMNDYRDELLEIYHKVSPLTDMAKAEETVNRLTNPLDNALNEKCSRIKAAFCSLMDDYSASYYIIDSQAQQFIADSPRKWFRRLKAIKLPRELVVYDRSAL
jgi:hypothetical protein